MERYYFDFEDDATAWHDNEGVEFAGASSACEEMRRSMLEIAKYARANDSNWKFTGIVRDKDSVIWSAQLSFETLRRPAD